MGWQAILQKENFMSKIPPEILKYKTPGTEIKCIRGKYYLQRVTSKWDPKTQKVRKLTLEYLGRVTADGVIPRKSKMIPAQTKVYSKEFGATWAIMQLCPDIYEKLKKHLPNYADWLYVTAVLRCIRHGAMKYTEALYDVSYLSEVFPNLNLSSSNLSNLMTSFGYMRSKMIDFMKDFIPSKDCFMLFDGTAMICNSSHINDAQRGYNSHGCHDPQINLIYAVAIREEKLMPVFYKRYPGSVRDVSAFANLRNEMGVKDIVAICDKGFSKKSDQTLMEECGIDYLMPLKRNNNEYTKEPLYKPGFMGFEGRFLYNGRIIWYYEQPSHEEDKHKYFLFLDETLQHLELSNIKQSFDIGNETPEELAAITEHQLLYGTICLKTSLKSYSAETVFKTYKMREEIEQLFDTYKCEEHFNTTGMHSPETQESCLFINHLSILMAYRVYERLRERNALKKFAAIKMPELLLWDVRVTNTGNEWQLEPIPKIARKAFEALGLTPPTVLKSEPMGNI